MKYQKGKRYIIKTNLATKNLNGKVFTCWATRIADGGCQEVWGDLETPLEENGRTYTRIKLTEENAVCIEIN